ncbi:MAG: nickel-responsive transcriptional regulator NikR [Candidatus Omnitrophica bacterium]|nr:nickel-responsive transcriptional regulator NikR [Candidatus Omnitrophota bacterium]
MKRFGVSLEDDLLRELDRLVQKHKLPNRSQAIRFLIRKTLIREDCQGNKLVTGCLAIVYDHHKRELLNKLVCLQHDFHHLILSGQHVHLDHDNCLETILLKGRAKELNDLAKKMIGLKGIKSGELITCPIR